MNYLIILSIFLNYLLLLLLFIIIWYNIHFNLKQIPYNIYIKQSDVGGKLGRGIFANKFFSQGEIIERAPCIEDDTNNFTGLIKDYIFNKDFDKKISSVAFGYASLYNHSDTPNATWKMIDDDILITAIKPIQKDDEILISYGDAYWTSRKDIINKD
jgi:SET domain-containing protein